MRGKPPSRAAFIKSCPMDMPVSEVIRLGAEAGLTINRNDYYSAHQDVRLKVARAARAAQKRIADKHVLHIHETPDSLTRVVSYFLGGSLHFRGGGGGAGIVFATSSHHDHFLRSLAADGVRVDAARRSGRLVLVDVENALGGIMLGGMPEPALFRAYVTRLIAGAEAAANGGCVGIYSELIDLLCASGNFPAALALEALWHELAHEHDFFLLCSVSAMCLDDEHRAQVVRTHTRVAT